MASTYNLVNLIEYRKKKCNIYEVRYTTYEITSLLVVYDSAELIVLLVKYGPYHLFTCFNCQ